MDVIVVAFLVVIATIIDVAVVVIIILISVAFLTRSHLNNLLQRIAEDLSFFVFERKLSLDHLTQRFDIGPLIVRFLGGTSRSAGKQSAKQH
jgi:hypothetical protein